jgi:hypothetical protein
MIAFPSMLCDAAENAGMAVPPDPENFDREEYPHFWIFCALQLARSTPYHGVHWDNAKVIAGLEVEKLKTMMLSDFEAAGFQF